MATLLDAAYGAGTSEEFSHRMDITDVLGEPVETFLTEEPTEDGGVAAEIAWRIDGDYIGIYRNIYTGDNVFTSGLWIEPRFTEKGILTHLIEELNEWWGELGLTSNTMEPTPGPAQKALESCGFGPLPDGRWGCELPSPHLAKFVAFASVSKHPPIF